MGLNLWKSKQYKYLSAAVLFPSLSLFCLFLQLPLLLLLFLLAVLSLSCFWGSVFLFSDCLLPSFPLEPHAPS